jgi:alanine-glyoxylate transaminase/(R)-3-amino-2-methylpropionate-pyruvate transaminase
MLRQQRKALLRLGSAQAAALAPSSGVIGGLWRSQSSQAAPVDIPAAPVLPPFDYVPPRYTGPSKEEVLSLRKQFLSPGA